MTSEPLICEDLTRRFGRRTAVDGVSLRLEPGRITALLGPSGCGKSTLLRMIAGLEPLDGGVIRHGETLIASTRQAMPPERRRVGLVFQDHALFPHLNVFDNVAFGLAELPRTERRERALHWLQRVGIGDRAGDWPHQLSGGQQQRVALARALAPEPRAILLDEPFSSLDAYLRAEVREDLTRTLKAAGVAALIVTHDARDAMLMADDLILMDQGRVLQAGSPEACYAQPVSLSAARLLGDVEVALGQRAGGRVTTPWGEVASDGPDGPAHIMFRPEALSLSTEGLEAKVVSVAYAGDQAEVDVERQGARATLLASPGAVRIGDDVRVRLDVARVIALD